MTPELIYRETLHTVDDLIKWLSRPELKGRRLCQVITAAVHLGGGGAAMTKVHFDEIDHFQWNADDCKLEIEI